jgi:deferrochelatase/peroxidase EfeB
MRKELIVKSKTLAGASDLTLLAPIKKGFVPSLDSVTYGTRAKRLMKTLTGGRTSSHEYSLIRPFADAVERVAVIHSFRVAVLEKENMILLAVTFDGTWESYIRTLWLKVGTLLDVIFCNSEGYVSAFDHTFEEWTEWVRRVQIEGHFFFSTSRSTAEDVSYLQGLERIHRSKDSNVTLTSTRMKIETAEDKAWNAAKLNPEEAFRQGLQSLSVLYRLTDMYLPSRNYADDKDEGKYLTRAARDLLLELRLIYDDRTLYDFVNNYFLQPRFKRQLEWLCPNPLSPKLQQRIVPKQVMDAADLPNWSKADVQGGIVETYNGVTHGCLVLIAFDTAANASTFVDRHIAQITSADVNLIKEEIALNIAVTYEGFRLFGLTEDQLAYFPQEFRQGMESRASVLGDFRTNHPRRWNLPTTNWPDKNAAKKTIELSAVHLIVQLRTQSESSVAVDITDSAHPLNPIIASLTIGKTGEVLTGVTILSVQEMQRYPKAGGKPAEHFGFADLESQPYIQPDVDSGGVAINENFSNQVQLGELLLGYENEADPPPKWSHLGQEKAAEAASLFKNGSYFVIRKLKQNVAALNDAMTKASNETGLEEKLILAKMMGREQNGDPLLPSGPGGLNDFNFVDDKEGRACPFHSHIRRTNPREILKSDFVNSDLAQFEFRGRRVPRLMRRSMPYGPIYDRANPDATSNTESRGLIFMAYNTSLAEQFEVVQRWISGGNSSGGFSRHSDPFLGVPENEEKRTYRFEHNSKSHSIELDGAEKWNDDRKLFVKLEWGMYSFVPSLSALRWLAKNAGQATKPQIPWSAEDGLARIKTLQEIDATHNSADGVAAWKDMLEDPQRQEDYVSASVWAAIRKYHGGVLRTPYGVLVAEKKLVMSVLRDSKLQYSVSGYHDRMMDSIGENYLGLDRPGDGSYESKSKLVNEAIGKITEEDSFKLAFEFTNEVLYKSILQVLPDITKAGFIAFEKFIAQRLGTSWELNVDVKEISDMVLAKLCQHWFGLPAVRDNDRDKDPQAVNDAGIVAGSWRWDWAAGESPIYPAQFTAPSRFIFQPNPSDDVKSYGCTYGKSLTAGVEKFLQPYRANNKIPTSPGPANSDAVLAKAIFDALPHASDSEVAQTFVGALMGFLPTVDGNLRLSLNEWLRDGTFWSLRAKWQADASPNDLVKAKRLLGPALTSSMQLRPSPELVWRTATKLHILGGEQINPGDVVVAAVVSATQQCLEEHQSDLYPIFGGDRKEVGAPTHACPGYGAAMGVLLGLIAALIGIKEKVRPSPAPLALTITEQ